MYIFKIENKYSIKIKILNRSNSNLLYYQCSRDILYYIQIIDLHFNMFMKICHLVWWHIIIVSLRPQGFRSILHTGIRIYHALCRQRHKYICNVGMCIYVKFGRATICVMPRSLRIWYSQLRKNHLWRIECSQQPLVKISVTTT